MNLSEALEFTIEHRDTWKTGSGAKTAIINANHCIRILGGDTLVEDIRTAHFTKVSRQLTQEGKSPNTVNQILSSLSTILNELKLNGIELPDVHFKRPRVPKNDKRGFFTEEEMDALLEAAKQHRDHLLLHDAILVSIKTGCRQGELLKLTADDIDFQNETITFRNTKNGSDHVLHLNSDLIEPLRRRIQFRLFDDLLFPFLNKWALLRQFKKLKTEAGLPQDSRVWHSIRHTTGTWLVERNVPIRTIMGVLNHSNVQTTLRYAKATDRSVANAIDLL